jgi:hypothetical protein
MLRMRELELNRLVPHYRLSTASSVKQEVVWSHYFEGVVQPVIVGTPRCLELPTGSVLVLYSSADPERVFVEIRCQFALVDNGVDLASAEDFLLFCESAGTAIRVGRNGNAIPASIGALLSDIKSSRAFRWALHLATHPRDIPAQRRFASEIAGRL